MSDTIASAYADNDILQFLLNDRISSTGLSLPIPVWFSTLRLATKNLNLPSVDETVCHALAQHVRKISEGRQIQANAQEEVRVAKEDAETAIEAAKQTATLETQKRLFAAEASEKIWRRHAAQTTKLAASTEKRINVLQDMHRKNVESLGKRLGSLEDKVEKAQTDGDDAAVKKLGADASKARDEVEKAEKKRVELLEHDYSILQARSLKLRAEKEKIETKLVEARTHGFTPDTQRVEESRVQIETARGEHDTLHGDFAQLDKKHAELEAKHAVLGVAHAALQAKYDKVKATLDKAVERARANRRSRVSGAGGAVAENGSGQGEKRAVPEEDDQMGGDEKRARIGMEGVKEVETSIELAGTRETMIQVQARMEMEVRPRN